MSEGAFGRMRGCSRALTSESFLSDEEVMMTLAAAFKAIYKSISKLSRDTEIDNHLSSKQRHSARSKAQDGVPGFQRRVVAVERGPSSSGGDGESAAFFVTHVSGHADELGLIDDEVFCEGIQSAGIVEGKSRHTLSDTVDRAAETSDHGVHLNVFILQNTL